MSKTSSKCYFCNKRINEDNSHKLVDNHDYRICRQCTQLGYYKEAIAIIKHNDEVRKAKSK